MMKLFIYTKRSAPRRKGKRYRIAIIAEDMADARRVLESATTELAGSVLLPVLVTNLQSALLTFFLNHLKEDGEPKDDGVGLVGHELRRGIFPLGSLLCSR